MERQAALKVLAQVRQLREKCAQLPARTEMFDVAPVAAPTYDPAAVAEHIAKGRSLYDQLHMQNMLSGWKGIAALGLGGGLALGGGQGLYDLIKRRLFPQKRKTQHIAFVPVQDLDSGTRKTASWLTGDSAGGELNSTPIYNTLRTGIGLAAAAGGWKGLEALLQARREQEQEQQVADAEEEFNTALRGLQPAKAKRPSIKVAAELGQALDKLYDKLEKRAVADWPGFLAGSIYGPYAALSALISGYGTYKAVSKGSQEQIIRRALERRARRRQAVQPAELYAAPMTTE